MIILGENYLSERKQHVVINNSTSSWRDINAGVSQGSFGAFAVHCFHR